MDTGNVAHRTIQTLIHANRKWRTYVLLAFFLAGTAILFKWHSGFIFNATPSNNAEDIELFNQALSPPPKPSRVSIPQLTELALMGKYQAPKSTAPPKLDDIPETALELSLQGVFASKDKSLSAALIKVDKETPDYFTIGSEIDPGLVIAAIDNDGVTLKSEEGYEKLVFKHPDIWQDNSTSPSSSEPTNAYHPPIPASKQPLSQDELMAPISNNVARIDNKTSKEHSNAAGAQTALADRLQSIRDTLKK